MTDWSQIKEVFADALEADADERVAVVETGCAGDAEARREVLALLAAHGRADGLFTSAPELPDAANAGDLHVPARIGHYEIEERLGEGGFGVVHRAMQLEPVKRAVAIKILKRGMDSRQVVARFAAERQLLARMSHPHIARVLDAGTADDGRPFVVMELVPGHSILEHCRIHGLMLEARVRLFARVCRAVAHAHQRAIIHRDLKPSNILVVEEDGAAHPRIIDFGIAKALEDDGHGERTQGGGFLGTPRYASPEQLAGESGVDTRTDVYALGVVLCELLTGALPRDPKRMSSRSTTEHAAARPSSLAAQVESPPAVAKALRGDLDRIVLKAVAWDPDERYDTAAALAGELERYLAGEPILAAPPGAWYRFRKVVRRHRVASAAIAVAVLALCLGTAGAVAGLLQALDDRAVARQAARQAEFVTAFMLEDMIEAADPDIAQGRGITVRDVLDAAARNAERLADEPEVQLQLLELVGSAYWKLRQEPEADRVLSRALELSERLRGPNARETIDLMTTYAEVLMMQTRYSEGDALRQRAHERAEVALDELDPARLRIRQYFAGGVEAMEVLDVHYRLSVAAGSSDHIRLLGFLAGRYAAEHRLEHALETRHRALEMAEQRFGKRHTLTIDALVGYAKAMDTLDTSAEALALMEEALALAEDLLEEMHPNRRWIMYELARMYAVRERYADAIHFARETERLAELAFGRDSIQHVSAEQALGKVLLLSGDAAAALPLLERVVRLRAEQWNDDHPYTIWGHTEVAQAYLGVGRAEDALRHCDVALAATGDSDERLPEAHATRARALAALGRAAEAEASVAEARAHLLRLFDPGHERVAEVEAMLELVQPPAD